MYIILKKILFNTNLKFEELSGKSTRCRDSQRQIDAKYPETNFGHRDMRSKTVEGTQKSMPPKVVSQHLLSFETVW